MDGRVTCSRYRHHFFKVTFTGSTLAPNRNFLSFVRQSHWPWWLVTDLRFHPGSRPDRHRHAAVLPLVAVPVVPTPPQLGGGGGGSDPIRSTTADWSGLSQLVAPLCPSPAQLMLMVVPSRLRRRRRCRRSGWGRAPRLALQSARQAGSGRVDRPTRTWAGGPPGSWFFVSRLLGRRRLEPGEFLLRRRP